MTVSENPDGSYNKYEVEAEYKNKGKCIYNCWNCHHSKWGARSGEHQFPDREKDCTIRSKYELKNVHTYKHDCESCDFLGTVNLNEPYNKHTKLDLYVCAHKPLPVFEHSLLARYGSHGYEYMSCHPNYLHDRLFPLYPEKDHKQFSLASEELYSLLFSRWKKWYGEKHGKYNFNLAMYECYKPTVERSQHNSRLMSDLGIYPPMKILTEEEFNERG